MLRAHAVIALVGVAGCLSVPSVQFVDDDAGSSSGGPLDASSDDGAPPAVACVDAVCSAAGGACQGNVCVIQCQGSGGTTPKCPDVKCPAGACRVTCNGAQACGSVDCVQATSCEIACRGGNSCVNVRGNGTSRITCDGSNGDPACTGAIRCDGPSCAITCSSNGCKSNQVSCCATQCTLNGTPTKC